MRLWYSISYLIWICVEIVKGAVDVARGVYSPETRSSPAIVEYPLRGRTDGEILAMASSITITPGTLVVGTAHGTGDEPASLFVHALFASSREEVVEGLIEMEDRLLRATRGRGGADAEPKRYRGRRDGTFADSRAADAVRSEGRDDRDEQSEEER